MVGILGKLNASVEQPRMSVFMNIKSNETYETYEQLWDFYNALGIQLSRLDKSTFEIKLLIFNQRYYSILTDLIFVTTETPKFEDSKITTKISF